MEYMAMLEEPGLVSGLQELIHDTEPSVVKRTIRVFTNVYRHSLSLLATGDLDPVKYENCYAEINMVSNDLIDMLKTADNEGVVVHLVRYLEAALVSHILSDISKHPHIALMTAPMLKKGVTALLDLVDTPYVGGTAFCVAIRALITVACYQVDMRPKITDVCEALINSPPPNLFDHNVRSFHKTLQRNLFRLLKRAEEDAEKERLVDLMVRVGVPRKRLVEWGPRPNKKRPASTTRETTRYDGKGLLPASKRVRLTEEQIIRLSPPVGTRSKIFSPPPSLSSQKSPITIKSTSEEPAPASISSILDQILSGDKVSDLNWLPPVKKTERKSIHSILKEKSFAAVNRGKISAPSPTYDPLNTIRGILKLPASSWVDSRTSGRISPEQQSKENAPEHSSGRSSALESKSGCNSPSHPTLSRNSPKQSDVLDNPASPSSAVPSDRESTPPRSASISPCPASGHNSPVHLTGRNSPKGRGTRNLPKQIPLLREGSANATISFEAASGLVTDADQSNTDEQTNIRNTIRQQGFTPKERLFFEKLTTERVVEMLLTSTMNVPAETPKYIPRINLEPLEVMKEKLAILLAIYIPDSSMTQKSEHKTVGIRKAEEKSVASKSNTVTSSESISSEVTSMETDRLFFSKDFDLRQGMSNSGDIDMRNMSLYCDPFKPYASFTSSQSKDSDPRKQNELERHSKPATRDPRLAAQSATASDPRLNSNRLHGNPPVSSSDPRLQNATPIPVSYFPPLPPSTVAVQTQPPPPPSRDPRLAARQSPPVPPVFNGHAAGTPAVPASYGPTAGIYSAPTTFTAPAAYDINATYAAPATYPSPANYSTLAPPPYGVSSSAPQLPPSRDPRLKAGPSGAQGVNSLPVLPSYPISQPAFNVYPNGYTGLSNINNAYSGRLF